MILRKLANTFSPCCLPSAQRKPSRPSVKQAFPWLVVAIGGLWQRGGSRSHHGSASSPGVAWGLLVPVGMLSPSRLGPLCAWLWVAAANHLRAQPGLRGAGFLRQSLFALYERCMPTNPCRSAFRNGHLLQGVSLTPHFMKSIIWIFVVQNRSAIKYTYSLRGLGSLGLRLRLSRPARRVCVGRTKWCDALAASLGTHEGFSAVTSDWTEENAKLREEPLIFPVISVSPALFFLLPAG